VGKHQVKRGIVSGAGKAGDNSITFKGKTSTGKLKPGKYTVAITAKDASGRRSKAQSLKFTISS
jgi:flagellar hook assembly protein FlgD